MLHNNSQDVVINCAEIYHLNKVFYARLPSWGGNQEGEVGDKWGRSMQRKGLLMWDHPHIHIFLSTCSNTNNTHRTNTEYGLISSIKDFPPSPPPLWTSLCFKSRESNWVFALLHTNKLEQFSTGEYTAAISTVKLRTIFFENQWCSRARAGCRELFNIFL